MNTGEIILISASVLPTNATNKGVIWSWTSTDGGVITLTNGSVKALKAGTVTVTAKAADNNGAQATCIITISGAPIATPTPTPAPTVTPTPGPTGGIWCRVNTEKGALNMRDKIGGAVIAKIPEKAFFIVTEYGATWCKAWYDGKTGYVMTKFVKLTGGSMPTPTPVPTPA